MVSHCVQDKVQCLLPELLFDLINLFHFLSCYGLHHVSPPARMVSFLSQRHLIRQHNSMCEGRLWTQDCLTEFQLTLNSCVTLSKKLNLSVP